MQQFPIFTHFCSSSDTADGRRQHARAVRSYHHPRTGPKNSERQHESSYMMLIQSSQYEYRSNNQHTRPTRTRFNLGRTRRRWLYGTATAHRREPATSQADHQPQTHAAPSESKVSESVVRENNRFWLIYARMTEQEAMENVLDLEQTLLDDPTTANRPPR